MHRHEFSSRNDDWVVRAPRSERYEPYWQRLAALYAEAAESRLMQEIPRAHRPPNAVRRILRSVIARLGTSTDRSGTTRLPR